jgi:AraC family transcriptional regulator of adaptative response/methylated-DNA-[protein]-cysteine methyltransferase
VLDRDAAADGQFVYAVRTTGIYCRPSCPARRPRVDNVAFHHTPSEAEAAGFRACLRCRPEEHRASPRIERVHQLCRLLERTGGPPTLTELAQSVGLSPFHTHRLFKTTTGLTPRAYAIACRRALVRRALGEEPSVTAAIYRAGYTSSGRFYDEAPRILGMTPTQYRAGSPPDRVLFAVGQHTLGAVLVAATPKGVCAILLGDDPATLVRDLEDRFPRAELVGGDEAFESHVAAVIGAIAEPGAAQALPLDVRGTVFQQRVWEALRAIPAGETRTYADIARTIGQSKAARAVARACAANPVAIAIPCHRVVRRDGCESGFRWGIERKRRLLAEETNR